MNSEKSGDKIANLCPGDCFPLAWSNLFNVCPEKYFMGENSVEEKKKLQVFSEYKRKEVWIPEE